MKELNNYIWSNKKAGVPKDIYNHNRCIKIYYILYILRTVGGETNVLQL